MELTLRYRGVLHSAGGKNRIQEKHNVRTALSGQLERYWSEDPRLDGMYNKWKELQIPAQSSGRFVVKRPLATGDNFWWRWPLNGYNFIPLLTHIHEATCELDIRLYRRKEVGGVLFEGGDIDNRLKIFLDALQVPKYSEEVPKNPEDIESHENWPPVFCLVDDDSAVTKLSINSLKLLTEVPEEITDKQNYVELDVDVKITPVTPMGGTWMLSHP